MKKNLHYLLMLIAIPYFATTNAKAPIILLDPAGHANHLGRKLSSGYERGATLHVAEELQKLLQQAYNISSILSRKPGETVYPLQTASFANRLQVSLVINLNIYHTTQEKPKIHIYHLCYNPFIEFSATPPELTRFLPLDKAHLVHLKKSSEIAKRLHHLLTQETYAKQWDVFAPLAIPLNPLKGIVPPAISIEIGINEKKKLESLTPVLAESIAKIV